MTKKRKLYFDGLKGIACLFIMFGHFAGIYKYAVDATAIESSFLKSFTIFPISFLTAENFWLYLFFAVSGYLVASSKVESVRDICRKSVVRFFRFFIPIVGIIIVAFLIDKTIGYHNQELRSIIDNPWYFRSYQEAFTFNDLVLEPVRVLVQGTSQFDSPLWVMRDMLLASMLIYAISDAIRSNKTVTIGGGYALVCILLPICIGLKCFVIFGCLCGACCKWLEVYLSKITLFKPVFWIVSFALIGAYFLNNNFVTAALFSIWIIALKESCVVKLFDNKLMSGLGSISLGIFMIHWPIYNSVGALMINSFYGHLSNGFLMAFVFMLIFIIVGVCAIAFRVTVERITALICKAVDNRLKLVLGSVGK